MKFRYDMQESLGFQLAPMLDVVFLLLIFFIVTQTFALTEQDLEVKVPDVEGNEDKDQSRALHEIILNVRQDGSVTINREMIPLDKVASKMERVVAAGGSSTPVLIRGDAEAKYQFIMDVLNECRKVGIWNIRFSVKQPSKEQGNVTPVAS